MKQRVLLLGAAGVALLSSCCHWEPSVTKPVAVNRTHHLRGRRCPASASLSSRVPERIHVYDVGRLPSRDGRSITEAGKWYHLEQSAYGNRFVPGSHAVINMGPTEQIAARAYRPVPNDPQVTELRNEALQDKKRAADALGQIQLAKEKLGIATQNAQKTNEIIAEAMNKVRALHEENEALKRQLEMHKAKEPSPDPDFSKFEQTTTKHPSGLAPGPVQ
jgi:hypothetical protein